MYVVVILFCTVRFQERERRYRDENDRSFWDLSLCGGSESWSGGKRNIRTWLLEQRTDDMQANSALPEAADGNNRLGL